jgi:hypothetical protein
MPEPPAVRDNAALLDRLVAVGDLAQLSAAERNNYYKAVCESLGLNALTRPFEYITMKGKLVLYARKDCTDQLRRLHNVSITRLERSVENGVYTVVAHAQTPEGRCDAAMGAVSVEGLSGEDRALAYMRCETKAKRRVTLSLCGLGITDEAEVEPAVAHFRQQPAALPQQQPATPAQEAQAAPAAPAVSAERLARLREMLTTVKAPAQKVANTLKDYRVSRLEDMTEGDAADLEARLARHMPKPESN